MAHTMSGIWLFISGQKILSPLYLAIPHYEMPSLSPKLKKEPFIELIWIISSAKWSFFKRGQNGSRGFWWQSNLLSTRWIFYSNSKWSAGSSPSKATARMVLIFQFWIKQKVWNSIAKIPECTWSVPKCEIFSNFYRDY